NSQFSIFNFQLSTFHFQLLLLLCIYVPLISTKDPYRQSFLTKQVRHCGISKSKTNSYRRLYTFIPNRYGAAFNLCSSWYKDLILPGNIKSFEGISLAHQALFGIIKR